MRLPYDMSNMKIGKRIRLRNSGGFEKFVFSIIFFGQQHLTHYFIENIPDRELRSGQRELCLRFFPSLLFYKI